MPVLKIKLTGALLLFVHFICMAQTLKFEKYTTKNGLLSDEVFNIHQDNKGYIWAFTNYGALKYNSVEFKQVLKNLPFSESFVYSFFERKDGRKWIANSNAKIYEIRNDSAFQIKGVESLSEMLREAVDEIGQLIVADDGKIYALTKRYSYVLTPHGDNTYSFAYLNNKKDCDSLVYEIRELDGQLLQIANVLTKETGDLYNRPGRIYVSLLTKEDPWVFELDRKSILGPKEFRKYGRNVYFSYYNRLARVFNKTLTYIQFPGYVLDFTKDKNNHLWVCCYNGGLYELDEKDSIIHHYFGSITINRLLMDSQNGLWASSSGHGLFHCSNIDNLSFEESTALDGSINILKKIGDELFIADAHGDLYKVKHNEFKVIKKSDQIVIPTDIIISGNNYVVSSQFNVEHLVIYKGYLEWLKRQNLLILSGFKLIKLSNDSIFYMFRKGVGLAVNGKVIKRVEVNEKTYDVKLRNGLFLMATEKGVYQHNFNLNAIPAPGKYLPIVYDTLRPAQLLLPTKNAHVKKIVRDSMGYWFCSLGAGLFLMDQNDHISNYTEEDGLPSNIINSICYENGQVLLSTNKGLFYSDAKKPFKKPGQWKNIYTGNVQNAIFFEKKIYVSTYNGLVILEGFDLNPNIYFNLASVSVNSKEVPLSQIGQLKYNKNSLEFKFDLIYYTEHAFKISYTLDGPYHDSQMTDGGTLNFQNLAPGSYTLTATPVVPNGGKIRITLRFTIVPAFWQTPVFYVILYIVFGALVAYIGWLMFKSYKKRQDKKITAEKLILEYRLIALKAQINPHFVSNCLTAIQHLIIQGKSHAAADYIAKFGFLVRQILNFSTRSLVTIKEELQIARLNIDLEQLRFENKFTYQLEIDPSLELEHIYVPALVLNPIIENSIWHGLLPLKNMRPGNLLIRVEKKNDMLFMIIKDNGVGRKPHETMSNIRESKGIKLTQQRLTNINYLYNIELSEIKYDDLVDADGNPAGTTVTISLPTNLKPATNE